MAGYRPVRVGEVIQAELAQLLLRELKDPRVRMATVSRVEVSRDLHHARVYISRMGTEAEQLTTLEGFERAAGFIRGLLGKRLTLRHIPQLTFELDTAIAYGIRISRMLHDILPPGPTGDAESDASHA